MLPPTQKQPIAVSLRPLDPVAINDEVDQRETLRNGQDAGLVVPRKMPGQQMASRTQSNSRRAIALDDSDALAIEPHIDRPVRGIPRKHQPLLGCKHLPSESEAAAIVVDREFEPAGPGADEIRLRCRSPIEQEWAITVLLACKHPRLPLTKAFGHIDFLRPRCRQQNEKNQEQSGNQKHWRLLAESLLSL